MEQTSSPKLKEAAAEIRAIIAKYDIGASIVLHTPGFSEYVNELSPSYSCIIEEGDNYRIRARLQEDYGGDREAWEKKITDTVNMLDLFAVTTGQVSLGLMDTLEKLNELMEIEKTPTVHTPHQENQ